MWFLQKWTNHESWSCHVLPAPPYKVPISLVVYRPAVTLQTFHHTSGALFLSSYNYFGLEFHFFLLCGQPCLWAVLFWREDTWVCCRKAPKQWQHRRNLSFSCFFTGWCWVLAVFLSFLWTISYIPRTECTGSPVTAEHGHSSGGDLLFIDHSTIWQLEAELIPSDSYAQNNHSYARSMF